jgi:hydroxyacyl-ACP dehydratase HTD2-like protein with hotdog domain
MASVALTWDSVEVGDRIPSLVKRPTPMQLFMFSASTWNRHLIHYNTEFAISDGLENVAVHRALIGGFLAQMLSEWVGDAGSILNVSWSVRGSAAINRPLTLRGEVLEKREEDGKRLLSCEIHAENHENETIAPGTALVRIG